MTQSNSSEERARYAQMTREECLDAFMLMIAHPHLITADQAVREAIRETGGALLIFVCGPPGVGKTTLKNQVIRKERVHILSLSARPSLSGSFDWKDFLQGGILALEQSWIDRKTVVDTGDEEESIHTAQPDRSGARRRPLNRAKDDDLRVSLETAIKRRRPAAIILDDAQHIGKLSMGR